MGRYYFVLHKYSEYLLVLLVLITIYFATLYGSDFNTFYFVGKFVVEGNSTEIYNHQALIDYAENYNTHCFRYLYPPSSALLFSMFTVFNLETSKLLWFTINLLLIFFFFRILRKHIFPEYNKILWIIIICLSILTVPIIRNLTLGQVNILIAFLWLCSFVLYSKNKTILPSLLLAIATMIKIYPGVMSLVLLRNKKYKDFVWFVVFCLLIFLITSFILGFDIWLKFLELGKENMNADIGYTGFKPILNKISPKITKFWLVFPILYIIFAYIFGKPFKKGWALFAVSMIISSPLIWGYHFLPMYFMMFYFSSKIKQKPIKYIFLFLCIFSIFRYSTLPLYFWRVPALLLALMIGFISSNMYLQHTIKED